MTMASIYSLLYVSHCAKSLLDSVRLNVGLNSKEQGPNQLHIKIA